MDLDPVPQVQTLVRELEKFTVPRQYPLIIAGDLNSGPDSSVYELLSSNRVRPDHPDVSGDEVGVLESADLQHSIMLADAYSPLGKYCA